MKIFMVLSFLTLIGSAKSATEESPLQPIEIFVAEEPVIEPDPVLPISRYVDFIDWIGPPQVGIFVTQGYSRHFIGGVNGANQKCRELAKKRKYGHGEFPESTRAFLFNSGANIQNFLPANTLLIRLEDYKRITTYGNLIGNSPTFQHSLQIGSGSWLAWSSIPATVIQQILRILVTAGQMTIHGPMVFISIEQATLFIQVYGVVMPIV